MIGIDTNVLVRYITQDHPKQSRVASRFIETHCSSESPGFIGLIVLAELVWVLKHAYQYDKKIIIQVLQQILATAEFKVEALPVARAALKAFQQHNADYSDYLIAHGNHQHGCDITVTLDKLAAKDMYFQALAD